MTERSRKPDDLAQATNLVMGLLQRSVVARWIALGLLLVVVGLAVWSPDTFLSVVAGGRTAATSPAAPSPNSPVPSPTVAPPAHGDRTVDRSEATVGETPPTARRGTRGDEPEAAATDKSETAAGRRTSRTETIDEPPAPTGRGRGPASSAALEELPQGVLRSSAGLLYTRGSEQGHRLRHVMAHARDEPDRPGQHGVFRPGDQDAVVGVIDEAYRQAQRGERTQRRTEEGRTVLTVDLGRPIGYLGGQAGARRNHPAARHVRLVLEGQRVITAYPIIP